MLRKLNPRRSPALIVAIIALIAALGGSAVAAGGLSGKQKKQVKKIATKVFNSKIGSATVANAGSATNAGHANNADHATSADTAAIGQSPLLYAHVNSNGTVDPSLSRGITNANVVNDPDNTGSYCFKGISGAKTVMAVADGGNAEDASVQVGSGSGLCASVSGTQFRVATDDGSKSFPDLPFFVWFFGP